jgi:hypothetical protein
MLLLLAGVVIITTAVAFHRVGAVLGRWFGGANGYAIAGPICCACGGISFMFSIGNLDHPDALFMFGALGGLIAGCIVGPIYGFLILCQPERRQIPDVANAKVSVVILIIELLVGIAGVCYVIFRE